MAEETDPIERFYARYKADLELEKIQNGPHWHRLIWQEAYNRDYSMDWLVDGLWPVGRHLHVFAAAKTGKSLLFLWIAANIAIGRDPFTNTKTVARIVAYVDREMTEQDVIERCQDMGFEWEDLENLCYYLFPDVEPLDTNEGGKQIVELVDECQAEVLMLDTLSRVVRGEENSNDTYRNFHLYTGSRLKARGISMARLDHEGKVSGSSRGASAKVDDVDLVYQMQAVEGGLKLKKTAARVSFTRDDISLVKGDDPLSFSSTGERLWPAGTMDRAKLMDDLDMPIDITKRQAMALFRDHDMPPGKTTILLAAINYRKWKLPLL